MLFLQSWVVASNSGSFGGETYTVRDDVGVTLEAALGVTVGLLITGKVPDDQGLVAGSGQQHVGAIIKRSSQKIVPSKIQFAHSE